MLKDGADGALKPTDIGNSRMLHGTRHLLQLAADDLDFLVQLCEGQIVIRRGGDILQPDSEILQQCFNMDRQRSGCSLAHHALDTVQPGGKLGRRVFHGRDLALQNLQRFQNTAIMGGNLTGHDQPLQFIEITVNRLDRTEITGRVHAQRCELVGQRIQTIPHGRHLPLQRSDTGIGR